MYFKEFEKENGPDFVTVFDAMKASLKFLQITIKASSVFANLELYKNIFANIICSNLLNTSLAAKVIHLTLKRGIST